MTASKGNVSSDEPLKGGVVAPMTPRPFAIRELCWETESTLTWTLEAEDGKPFSFLPGQFNMLYLFGVGEIPISISGDPQRQEELVHTIRVVGAVTEAMKKLQVGDVIGVRGPFGTAWPVQEAEGRDLLLLAGGIGLAPLRPVIYALLANRARYGKVTLLVGARQPSEILFREEFVQWLSELQVDVTVDVGLNGWRGHVGLITERIRHASFEPSDTDAMICGPEVMMDFCARELLKCGVSPARIALSTERNMRCAVGWCGHCQLGPHFICKDGPVFPYPTIRPWLRRREA